MTSKPFALAIAAALIGSTSFAFAQGAPENRPSTAMQKSGQPSSADSPAVQPGLKAPMTGRSESTTPSGRSIAPEDAPAVQGGVH